jgi:putative NIF3 family GTP cyclohydrolase 1 type 2
MSVETSVVIRILEELAPAGLAESWDNSGFQLGDPGAAINRVLTLDVTAAVAAEASERGAELIVSHHPL